MGGLRSDGANYFDKFERADRLLNGKTADATNESSRANHSRTTAMNACTRP
jgi:hypothetical protein